MPRRASRVSNRQLSARLVQEDGRPFADAAHDSAPHADEALFDLPSNGSMEVRIPVSATYDRWVGTGEHATVEAAKLSPARYAVEVILGGIGGERPRLVPIEIR